MNKISLQKLNFVEYQNTAIENLQINNDKLLVSKNHGQLELINLKSLQILFSHQFDNFQQIVNIFWVDESLFVVTTDQSNVYIFNTNNIQNFQVQKMDTLKTLHCNFAILNKQAPQNNNQMEEDESFDSDIQSFDQQINYNGLYLCLALESGEVKIYKSEFNKEKLYFNFLNTISNMTEKNQQIGSIVLDVNQTCIIIGYNNGQVKKNNIYQNGNNIWTLDTIEKSIIKLEIFNDKFCIAGQSDGSILVIQTEYGVLMQDIKLDNCEIQSILCNDNHFYVSCSNQRIYHYIYNIKDQNFQQVAKNLTKQIQTKSMVFYKKGDKEQIIAGGIKEDLIQHKLKDGYLQRQQFKVLIDTLMQQNFIFYCNENIIGYYYMNNIQLLKIEDQKQTIIFRLKSYDFFQSISFNSKLNILACQSKNHLKFYDILKGKQTKTIDKNYKNILFLRNQLICYDQINQNIDYLDSQQNFKCLKKVSVNNLPNSPSQFQLSYNKTQLMICSLLEEKCSLLKISTGEVLNLDFLLQNKNTKYISFYQKQDNLFTIQNKIKVYSTQKQQTYSILLKNKLPFIQSIRNFIFDFQDKFKGVLITKNQMVKFELKQNGDQDVQILQEEPIFVQMINKDTLLYFYINRNRQIKKDFKTYSDFSNDKF